MSEFPGRKGDIDYLADAPPATYSPYDDVPDDEDAEETPSPSVSTVPVAESQPAPPQVGDHEPGNPEPRPRAPRAVPAVAVGPGDVRIGLWGAPRSGKTTYLSALCIAAQRPVMGNDWSISGCDPASVDFLTESVKRFVREKDFPRPTRAHRTLAWRFEGTRHLDPGGRFSGLRRVLSANSARRVDDEFVVEMQDAPGESFGEGEEAKIADDVQNHLRKADGIVYVFDPIGNADLRTKSFDFYYDTLERLKATMREHGLMVGGRLPHFVSVCVTKFDHPDVFNAAMKAGIIYQEHEGTMPVVPSSIAPEFLRSLCQDDASRYVCTSLTSDFLPERVSYFATSAVGFHLDNGKFDLGSFSNVTPDGNHFRSAATPINVLEPIISLVRSVRKAREQEGTA